jgi:hypothetical protein
MVQHLFEGTSLGSLTSSFHTDAYVVGTRFGFTAETPITGVRWYRGATTGDGAPTRIDIWRASDGAHIAGPFTPVDSGAVGWQEQELVTPVVVPASTTYVVSMDVPAATTWRYWLRADIAAAPSPAAFDDDIRGSTTPDHAYPGTHDNVLAWAIDIAWAGPSGGGTGGGGTSTTADLAAWLSTDGAVQTHETDGIPWETHTLQTGASGFDAIKAVADAIAAAVSGIPGTIAGAVTTITGQLTDMTGTMFDTGIATIGSISHDMATVMSKVLDTFSGLAGGAPGALSGRTAFPTELWTLIDEADHTGPFVYDQAADLYVLTVTDADGQTPTTVVGVQWYPRIGWWCPFNGTQGTQRRFWDLAENQLDDQGRRMPGVLVWTRPLVETHIQAWQLT